MRISSNELLIGFKMQVFGYTVSFADDGEEGAEVLDKDEWLLEEAYVFEGICLCFEEIVRMVYEVGEELVLFGLLLLLTEGIGVLARLQILGHAVPHLLLDAGEDEIQDGVLEQYRVVVLDDD